MQIITVAMILLKILKIIGIVFFAALLLILVLAAIILFTPVRYRLDASKKEESFLLCKAGISWLFIRFVNVEYDNKKLKYRLYVPFFMDKRSGYQKPEQDSKGDSLNKDNEAIDRKSNIVEDYPESEVYKDNPIYKEPVSESVDKQNTVSQITVPEDDGTTGPTPEASTIGESGFKAEDSISLFDVISSKIKGFIDRITGIFQDTADRIITIIKMPENLSKKKDIIYNFLNKKNTKYTIEYAKELLRKICNLIKPKKVKGNLHFGFVDPYNTGSLLAFLSVLYPLYAGSLRVDPDFENRVLAGDLKIKGRFILFPLVIMALKTLFDKRVKITVKELRKLDLSVT